VEDPIEVRDSTAPMSTAPTSSPLAPNAGIAVDGNTVKRKAFRGRKEFSDR
jgi:hypothetical protein